MKTKTLILAFGSLLFALSLNAALTIAVDITGSPSENDILAATRIVEQENERRAALETPETPLPYATLQELAASYETLLAGYVAQWHANYAAQVKREALETNVKQLWEEATDAQRAAAVAALQE